MRLVILAFDGIEEYIKQYGLTEMLQLEHGNVDKELIDVPLLLIEKRNNV